MKILVITHTHGLLPLAHRLKKEEHDVEVLTWVPKFERAWHGKVERRLAPKDIRVREGDGKLSQQVDLNLLEPVIKSANDGDTIVVSDVYKMNEPFKDAPFMYGVLPSDDPPTSNLRVGAWFDGEQFTCPHWMVVDLGSWPGGLGPMRPGGITLIRCPEFPATFGDRMDTLSTTLRESCFRGLVQVGLVETSEGLEPQGLRAGWPWLQTHAWLAELPDLGHTLAGTRPPTLPRKVVTVLPVSIPPYPVQDTRLQSRQYQVNSLTPQQQGQVFWHDIQVDPEARTIRTGGLDGLVGCVQGSAELPDLARARALEIAARIRLPEVQLRLDVGGQVGAILAKLEAAYGIVL